MVNPIRGSLAAVAEVEAGDAQMLEKRRVIGAGAERVDAQIRPLPDLAPVLRARLDDLGGAESLAYRDFFLRVDDVIGNFIDEFLQRVRAADVQEAPGVAVAVDIDRGML